jgi:hypothetical protein
MAQPVGIEEVAMARLSLSEMAGRCVHGLVHVKPFPPGIKNKELVGPWAMAQVFALLLLHGSSLAGMLLMV